MTNAHDDTRTVGDVADAGDVVMVAVRDSSGRLSSRPLTVAEAERGALRFLVDRSADWIGAVEADRQVNASLTASGRNVWASFSGAAELSGDRTLVDRLWSKPAGAYFGGPDDPNIAVLTVDVVDGEYWSAPGGGPIGRLVSMVGSAVGRGDAVNDHGPVRG